MKGFSLNCVELQDYQPNRYPFLMIDHVTEVVPGKSAKGFKNLTLNEWYFPDHFPGAPNMPGVLQLEAIAQMLTIAITTMDGYKGKVVHALSHTVRFKREILPGETLEIETVLNSYKRGIAKGRGVGYVKGQIACEADMVLSVPDELKSFLPEKG